MARGLLLLLLLVGCTPPSSPIVTERAPFRVAYLPGRLQPLNCGTPDEFKICPVPHTLVMKVEDLPPIIVPSVEIEQLPQTPTSQAGF
jgi:hypothetical protein